MNLSRVGPSLPDIVSALRAHSGIDFEAFRRSTLESAVETRAGVLGLTPESYSARVQHDAAERTSLLEACLVGHTSFFRDTDVMRALANRVLPALSRAAPSSVVRAWVAGAATGEEAWSLAMLLDAATPGRFDVLATDVSATALKHAARAEYAPQTFPAGFAEGSFEFDVDVMRVRPELQARVHFAEHDLTGPRLLPPSAIVANFDLVSCRNVLMWFDERFRTLALERFAAVLRPGGVLVLGRSESLPSSMNRAFSPLAGVDVSLRIFERVA